MKDIQPTEPLTPEEMAFIVHEVLPELIRNLKWKQDADAYRAMRTEDKGGAFETEAEYLEQSAAWCVTTMQYLEGLIRQPNTDPYVHQVGHPYSVKAQLDRRAKAAAVAA